MLNSEFAGDQRDWMSDIARSQSPQRSGCRVPTEGNTVGKTKKWPEYTLLCMRMCPSKLRMLVLQRVGLLDPRGTRLIPQDQDSTIASAEPDVASLDDTNDTVSMTPCEANQGRFSPGRYSSRDYQYT